MAKLSRDGRMLGQPLHPRETLRATGNLGGVGAEVLLEVDGASTVGIDLRGTMNMTAVLEGTIDGSNWLAIPCRAINQAAVGYLGNFSFTGPLMLVAKCAGYSQVRVRVTAWTSGTAACVLTGHNGLLDENFGLTSTPLLVTATGAAGAAVTVTLPSPGVGLRHYLTYLSIVRFAAAAMTAAAAPVLATTTNLPGGLAFTLPADAALQGSTNVLREDFAYALAASAQNTATTIVLPATPNVIWRGTAGYFNAA